MPITTTVSFWYAVHSIHVSQFLIRKVLDLKKKVDVEMETRHSLKSCKMMWELVSRQNCEDTMYTFSINPNCWYIRYMGA